jgi:hypothetical protein
LELAGGEIIGFLNTDDLYAEDIFHVVAGKFEDAEVMAVAGRAIVFSELSNGSTEIVDQYSPQESSLMESSTIGSNFFNAWFFRRSAFDRIGKFKALQGCRRPGFHAAVCPEGSEIYDYS